MPFQSLKERRWEPGRAAGEKSCAAHLLRALAVAQKLTSTAEEPRGSSFQVPAVYLATRVHPPPSVVMSQYTLRTVVPSDMVTLYTPSYVFPASYSSQL